MLALISAFRTRKHHGWNLLIEDIVGRAAGIANLIAQACLFIMTFRWRTVVRYEWWLTLAASPP